MVDLLADPALITIRVSSSPVLRAFEPHIANIILVPYFLPAALNSEVPKGPDDMSTHPNAPLIEAIFELRWGKTRKSAAATTIELSPEDSMFFLGQFNAVAISEGFTSVIPVRNPVGMPQMPGLPLPHQVSHRYMRPGNDNQVIQAGLGVLTVNHLASGYDWKPFKELINTGISLLDRGHPKRLTGLDLVFLELRYQDAFYYEDRQTALDVLRKNLTIQEIKLPSSMTSSSLVKAESLNIGSLNLVLNLTEIAGKLHLNFFDAEIAGKKGAILQLAVRSVPGDGEAATLNPTWLLDWCEKAHHAHMLAFNELIAPRRGSKA